MSYVTYVYLVYAIYDLCVLCAAVLPYCATALPHTVTSHNGLSRTQELDDLLPPSAPGVRMKSQQGPVGPGRGHMLGLLQSLAGR